MIPNGNAFDGKHFFEHNGILYYRYRTFNKKHTRIKIEVVSSNSPCKQGIAIATSVDPLFKGKVLFNGEEIAELVDFQKKIIKKKKKHKMVFVIDENALSIPEVIIDFYVDEGEVFFGNASDLVGDYPGIIEKVSQQTGKTPDQFITYCYTSGIVPSYPLQSGNSFWIETIEEGYLRFHCNDHHMDDDYDDFIFDMIIIDEQE